MNKKFYKDYPEFLIRFWPSFTWGKKTKRDDKSNTVVGIGIRATNSFCNKDKEESLSKYLLYRANLYASIAFYALFLIDKWIIKSLFIR